MFGMMKILPFVLTGVMAAILFHIWTVRGYQNRETEMQMQIDQLVQNTVALRAAAAINLDTITQLERTSQRQNSQIQELTVQVGVIQSERDDYLTIFRQHDLTNLARQRPGLIQPRINRGTADVFSQLQEDTQP